MTAQTILPANSVTASGYDVDNSLRFNTGSADSLTKTLGTPTNNRKWTYSFWVKQCSNIGNLLNTGSDTAYIYFRPNNADPAPFGFSIEQYVSSFQYRIIPNMVFRDHSAWRHIVIAFDTTQGTASNRVKVYNNGTQITSFNTATYPSQNLDTQVNSAVSHKIGGLTGGTSQNLDGYLSEVCFIDGQQLAPTSFGEFDEDSGIWKPIDGLADDLTFGNNGFYLEFKQSGTGTNASGMGADTSGNDNHFAVANLTAVDQSTDTCTNNFATMNPLDNFYAGGTFAEGNLQVTSVNTGYTYNTSTFGVASGKWYWEVKWSAQDTGSSNQVQIGIAKRVTASATTWLGSQAYTYAYQGSSGHVLVSGGNATGSSSTTYAVGDIISVALDLDNNKIHFAKNGTYTNSSDPAGNTGGVVITAANSELEDSGFYFPAFGDGNNNLVQTGQFNFGAGPPYAISSGNADGNGIGNFEFAVPSGYLAICTKNISATNS